MKLADKVIHELQRDISLGKYKPGDLLPPEPALMEMFSVGRSTIREAIKTLSNAGVLKVQQGAGTTVCPPPESGEPLDKRLRRAARLEVIQVRTLLEVEIARLAATHRDDEDLHTLRQMLAERWQAIQEGDYAACGDADIRFHQAIARAAGNSVLADLYQTFTAVIRDSFQQRDQLHVAQFRHTHHLHTALLEAIAAQDDHAAVNMVQEILQTTAAV